MTFLLIAPLLSACDDRPPVVVTKTTVVRAVDPKPAATKGNEATTSSAQQSAASAAEALLPAAAESPLLAGGLGEVSGEPFWLDDDTLLIGSSGGALQFDVAAERASRSPITEPLQAVARGVIVGAGAQLQVLARSTQKRFARATDAGKAPAHVAVLAKGRRIAIIDAGLFSVVDLKLGEPIFEAKADKLIHQATSPDGGVVVLLEHNAGAERFLVWDDKRKKLSELKLRPDQRSATGFTFRPRQRRVVVGYEGALDVYDLRRWRRKAKLSPKLPPTVGTRDATRWRPLAFHDNKRVWVVEDRGISLATLGRATLPPVFLDDGLAAEGVALAGSAPAGSAPAGSASAGSASAGSASAGSASAGSAPAGAAPSDAASSSTAPDAARAELLRTAASADGSVLVAQGKGAGPVVAVRLKRRKLAVSTLLPSLRGLESGVSAIKVSPTGRWAALLFQGRLLVYDLKRDKASRPVRLHTLPPPLNMPSPPEPLLDAVAVLRRKELAALKKLKPERCQSAEACQELADRFSAAQMPAESALALRQLCRFGDMAGCRTVAGKLVADKRYEEALEVLFDLCLRHGEYEDCTTTPTKVATSLRFDRPRPSAVRPGEALCDSAVQRAFSTAKARCVWRGVSQRRMATRGETVGFRLTKVPRRLRKAFDLKEGDVVLDGGDLNAGYRCEPERIGMFLKRSCDHIAKRKREGRQGPLGFVFVSLEVADRDLKRSTRYEFR